MFVSAEGAGERYGALRSLVAVFHLGASRLPHWVPHPHSQGLSVPLGPWPWPWLRLSRPPGGSDSPVDRSRWRRAALGARGEAPGGRSLHSSPPVAGTLEPQTQGFPGAGQEGPLSTKTGKQPPALQGAPKTPVWLCSPSLADWERCWVSRCKHTQDWKHSRAAHVQSEIHWGDTTLFFFTQSSVFYSKSFMKTLTVRRFKDSNSIILKFSKNRRTTSSKMYIIPFFCQWTWQSGEKKVQRNPSTPKRIPTFRFMYILERLIIA